MPKRKFEYDVAISFLWEDRPLAERLKSELEEMFKVFVASREQERLAGQDGMSTFTSIYRTEARVVVTLYRPKYGTTKWTRVERNAIKSRGFDEDWDFCLLILLEPPGPKWYQSYNLYSGYTGKQQEMSEIVGAIKLKAKQQGATERALSFSEKAEREAARKEAAIRRIDLLRSDEGRQLARDEVQKLFDYVIAKADETKHARTLNVEVEVDSGRHGPRLLLRRNRCSILVQWEDLNWNYSGGNELTIEVFDGLSSFTRQTLRKPVLRTTSVIAFDIRDDLAFWNRSKNASDPTDIISSEELAESLIQRAWELELGKEFRPGGSRDIIS